MTAMTSSVLGTPMPGLVDLQVNGFRGIDLNSGDINGSALTTDEVIALTRELWTVGVTRYLPTLITGSETRLVAAMRVIAAARNTDPLVAHSIAGIHVEGPHISAADGARGAHDPAWIRPPDTAELDRWMAASDGLIRIITVAPEWDGIGAYIAHAVRRGVQVSIGHAAATAEDVRAAVRSGSTLSTHLGNGCTSTVPRHPNHLWAQLAADDLTATFIADGHHLPVDTLTAMIRAKGVPRSVFVSDAAPLAGSPPGEYETSVGGRVTVEPGGALRLSGTPLLAGSGASLLDCLAWATSHLPFGDADLWAMGSTAPARVLDGTQGDNGPGDDGQGDSMPGDDGQGDGTPGDDVVVEADGDTWRVTRTRIQGTVVHSD